MQITTIYSEAEQRKSYTLIKQSTVRRQILVLVYNNIIMVILLERSS